MSEVVFVHQDYNTGLTVQDLIDILQACPDKTKPIKMKNSIPMTVDIHEVWYWESGVPDSDGTVYLEGED